MALEPSLYGKSSSVKGQTAKVKPAVSSKKTTKKATLSTKKLQALKASKAYIQEAITEAAQKAGIPEDFLRAICTTESDLRADAFVYNDGGNDNHAFGMCQVLRKTAEKYVGKDPKCNQDFRNLERSAKTCKLFGPKLNALVAARYLREQIDRYDGHLFKAAAAFNSGSLRVCSAKGWVTNVKGERLRRCKPGDLLNRYYVNKVKLLLSEASPEIRDILHLADFTINSKTKS